MATLGGCQVFPANNAWNQDVSSLPVDPNSASYIGGDRSPAEPVPARRTSASDPAYGIPYIVVPANQPMAPITFTAYGDESDPGPYPIPPNAPVEGGSSSDGDRHVLVVQQGACKLYELYNAHPNGSGWNADAGAVWDLSSNALRPVRLDLGGRRRPADPAGLVRYDEVQRGADHPRSALHGFEDAEGVHPPGHALRELDHERRTCLPMGARLRLKASFDTSKYTGEARVILDGAEEVRHDRRGQRLELVHQRGHRLALERQRPEPAQDRAGERLRGGADGADQPLASAGYSVLSAKWRTAPGHRGCSED